MTAHVLRPGIRLGVYPQRQQSHEEGIEQLGAKWLSRSAHALSWRKYRRSHVVAQVRLAGEGLEQLEPDALQRRCEELRYALLRDGLKDHLMVRSFALIAEHAQRTLDMCYYDAQLFGAWVIANGNMAEMATGEGKTFTATLAAATAAMAGIPVHIITTNEYLAERDAVSMAPLYEALGLRVAAVVEAMDTDAKREAYRADVVYCTNKQVAFDYLRDRLISRNESGLLSLKFSQANLEHQLVLRGLCFAIVDEADSVLIDEARTPLILSREHEDDSQQKIYEQALALAADMEKNSQYRLFEREQKLELTAEGKQWLSERVQSMPGLWQGQRHREFLVHQALCALYLFKLDAHYLVRDGKIEIIDKNTGRTMADRSWQRGLHQMIECKEACEMSGRRETLASISYQRFFRRYLRLGGMSGTLKQVAGEMAEVYQQRVIAVPTHRPCLRVDRGIRLFRRASDKWIAVITELESIHTTGQPVLVGTGSVHDSELLGAFLVRKGIEHRVLNARQDSEEAQIVAQAGQRSQITIATGMAGRGTDIELGEGVAALGGLHVINTQCHEEFRVDRQLYGRCARQGDPGSVQTMVSLSDALLQDFYPGKLRAWLDKYLNEGRSMPQGLVKRLVRLSQKMMAKRYQLERKDVMQMDEKLGKLLAYTGPQE